MKIHRWLDFKVTKRCNNYSKKCAYCNVPVERENIKEQMPLSVIHRTLLDARSLGFDTFWLLGGEPSLREDAHELIAPLNDDPDVMLTILSNGKKRNDKMYYSLFDTSARRACIQISLDTLQPDNFKRADPAYSLALISDIKQMAIHMSRINHLCDVEVHCVISRENHKEFDQFVRFFAAKGIGVSLAMVCPWLIVEENPQNLNEFIKEEVISIATRIDHLHTGLEVDNFNPSVAAFIRKVLQETSPNSQMFCGAGLTHLIINGDGAVHRCMAESFLPTTSFGNIISERLHSIVRRLDVACSCRIKADCFDGFAWDKLAMEAFQGGYKK